MRCRDHLRSTGFRRVHYFFNKKMNCPWIKAIFQFFNDNERRRVRISKDRKQGQYAQSTGGKQPTRNLKIAFTKLKKNRFVEFRRQSRLNILCIG